MRTQDVFLLLAYCTLTLTALYCAARPRTPRRGRRYSRPPPRRSPRQARWKFRTSLQPTRRAAACDPPTTTAPSPKYELSHGVIPSQKEEKKINKKDWVVTSVVTEGRSDGNKTDSITSNFPMNDLSVCKLPKGGDGEENPKSREVISSPRVRYWCEWGTRVTGMGDFDDCVSQIGGEFVKCPLPPHKCALPSCQCSYFAQRYPIYRHNRTLSFHRSGHQLVPFRDSDSRAHL